MQNRRWFIFGIVSLLALSILLTVCGGGDDSSDRASNADDDQTPYDDDDFGDDDDDDDITPPLGGEPPAWSTPRQIGEADAQTPSVQIRDVDTIHVTYFAPQPESKLQGWLNWVTISDDPPGAEDPVSVAADVYKANWLYDGQRVDMIGVRATQIIHLISEDGGRQWRQGDAVANSDSAFCEGEARGYPARDEQDKLVVAFGFNHNSNIFGCVPQVKLASLDGEEWFEAIDVGSGYPVNLVLLGAKMVVPGTFGVFTSPDGETFTEVPGGDYTRDQVRGDDAVRLSNGKIWLITTYTWGVGDNRYVALVEYDPQTGAWISPRWDLAKGQAICRLPRLAVDGQNLVAVWAQDGYPVARLSRDGGISWSEAAAVIEQPVSAMQLDAADGKAALVYQTADGLFLTQFSY